MGRIQVSECLNLSDRFQPPSTYSGGAGGAAKKVFESQNFFRGSNLDEEGRGPGPPNPGRGCVDEDLGSEEGKTNEKPSCKQRLVQGEALDNGDRRNAALDQHHH